MGNLLIVNVLDDASRRYPSLQRLQTLSPIISFRRWLDAEHPECPIEERASRCKEYLLKCYRGEATLLDPVAAFHYANGAVLDRVLPEANPRYRPFPSLHDPLTHRIDTPATCLRPMALWPAIYTIGLDWPRGRPRSVKGSGTRERASLNCPKGWTRPVGSATRADPCTWQFLYGDSCRLPKR